MSIDLIEAYMKILIFLYWEEKVCKGPIPVGRIQDETDLADIDLIEALKVLHDRDWISLERDKGANEVRITDKGKIRADQLLSV